MANIIFFVGMVFCVWHEHDFLTAPPWRGEKEDAAS